VIHSHLNNAELQENEASIAWKSAATISICLGIFIYSVFFRTYSVGQTFHLFGDQIRDWRIAARAFSDLPLVGTPRVDGGTSFGPVYYWVLWLIYHTIGPWFDYLPHAGGYGLSILHASAESFLLYAMIEFGIAMPVALTASLILTSLPMESFLSATIWNPGLSASFAMSGVGWFLLRVKAMNAWNFLLISGLSIFAVQSHTPALFMAVPLVIAAAKAWRDQGGNRVWWLALGLVTSMVVVMELPYLYGHFFRLQAAGGETILQLRLGQLGGDLLSLLRSLRIVGSFHFVVMALMPLLIDSLSGNFAAAAMVWTVTALIVIVRNGLVAPIAILTIGTFMATWIGWSLWPNAFESYWLISAFGVFMVGLAVAVNFHWRSSGLILGCIGLVTVLSMQHRLFNERNAMSGLPEYGSLIDIARQVAAANVPVRDLQGVPTKFTEQLQYLVQILGGKIDSGALSIAKIDRSGRVSIESAHVAL